MPVVLAPAEVLAGLIAICVLFAAYLIAQIVNAIFSAVPIPVVGGAIGNAMSWFASHVLSAMSWLWDHTNPVAVWTALVNVWHDTEQGLHGVLFGDIQGALQWLYATAIPNAAHWAVQTAEAALQGLIGGVQAAVNGVLGFVAWAHTQLAALWQAVTVSIPGEIAAAERAVEGDLGRVAGALTADLNAVAVALEGDIGKVAGALQADIAAVAAGAEHALAVAVAGVEGAVDTTLGQVVRGIEGDIGRVIGAINAEVLPQLAGLWAAVRAAEGVIARVDECVTPICESGGAPNLGNLGRDLQAVGNLWELGLLFAMVAEAIRDPRASADAVATVAGPVASAGVAVIRGAVGIAEAA